MKAKRPILRILDYILIYKLEMVMVVIFALISSGCVIVAPFFVGRSIDGIIGKGNVDFRIITSNIMILIGLYIVNTVAGWFLASFSVSVSNKTVRDMRRDGFHKITTLPLEFLDRQKTGELMSKFSNDIDIIAEGLIQAFQQLFSGVVTIIGSMVFMIAINTFIAFVVFLVAPLALLVASKVSTRANKLFMRQQAVLAEYSGCVEEIIGNFNVVKALCAEDEVEEKASEINKRLYHYGQESQFSSSLVNPSTRLISNISYVSVGIIGGISGCAGGISIGAISSLLVYSAQFAKPLNEIAGIATQLYAALAAAKRFFSLLDETSEESEKEKSILGDVDGNVKFSNASFSYDKDSSLIKNLNVKVEKGKTVAIVGQTGAGKTTIVNLLMRFYNLDSGKILIDDKDAFELNRDSVRRSFGMVLQETFLFSGTVRDNISYSRDDATDEEIYQAAKSARAHGFITRLEKGYDTVIREDSGSISQGEKQLITIARAMLTKPKMLILDEATSSVDPRTEQKIQQALQIFMKGKTSFIIAHRLSTIKNADIILVMERGSIVEQGNHNELLAKDGFYAKLYNSQFDVS